jgi:fructose-bisphosphate aldolase class I
MIETVRALLAYPKGLLAMDESNATCDRRFEAVGIPQTEETRRAYRELIITTPGLSECVSGMILYDETIRQSRADGTPFVKLIQDLGIVPGIKVDTGAKELAGHASEKVTEGLDGLRDRLRVYFEMGARFAKWRAVIAIGESRPSRACVEANAHALARYAALCQEAGIVPIVEPETVMDGGHSMAASALTTEVALRALFASLAEQGVALEALILKPNMILPGSASPERPTPAAVAEITRSVLRRVVPAEVPGVAFLSGGQSGELASARLNAMNAPPSPNAGAPWTLTFSFARAIQQPALKIWAGRDENKQRSQTALLHRARCSRFAREGRYSAATETNKS